MTWKLLSPPFTLTQGTEYAAAMHLGLLEKSLATVDAITAKFTEAGFTGVTIDDSDAANPKANGTWGQATQSNVTLPEEIKDVWEWSP